MREHMNLGKETSLLAEKIWGETAKVQKNANGIKVLYVLGVGVYRSRAGWHTFLQNAMMSEVPLSMAMARAMFEEQE